MFISFVVATFNCIDRVRTLQSTVESFNGFPCEFLIADGGSTDGTVDELEKAKVKIVCSQKDRGIYDAWNRALPICKGSYISFIGVDDEPQRAFYESVYSQFADGAPDLIYGDYILRRGSRYRRCISPSTPVLLDPRTPVFDLPHPGALNHRRLFSTGGFDADFKLAGDLDFYVRVRRHGDISALKCDGIQSIVEATGLSRSVKAMRIYEGECRRIEQLHGVSMRLAAPALLPKLLSYSPTMFELVKAISWRLRGTRIETI